ncbi:hypothetical protein [Psychrobacillus antarcticus]|nr:hypothetical protein [Psychrobacillus antarcticus]
MENSPEIVTPIRFKRIKVKVRITSKIMANTNKTEPIIPSTTYPS